MRRVGLLLILSLLFASTSPSGSPTPSQRHTHAEKYVCPMHPDVSSGAPGACPQCGMQLVRVDPHKTGAYRLRVQTIPARVESGHPFTLRLAVLQSGRDEIVRDFSIVHEKPFHLFVISRDLEHYEHLHPGQEPDGVWAERLTLNRPGIYHVYVDVLPEGGTPQVLEGTFEVAGASGEVPRRDAKLEPDRTLTQTVGELEAELLLPDGGLRAGSDQHLTYRFRDARSGVPVRDIQPYLGAWGHAVMIDGDLQHFVHAHPGGSTDATLGGPELVFHATPPAPGTYRVWTQVKRNGTVRTIVSTLQVNPAR